MRAGKPQVLTGIFRFVCKCLSLVGSLHLEIFCLCYSVNWVRPNGTRTRETKEFEEDPELRVGAKSKFCKKD